MSVGAVLLQPQRLGRAEQSASDEAILADLATIGASIAYDLVKSGHVLEAFGTAAESAGARYIAQAENGLAGARTKLGALVEAPVQALETKAQSLGSIDSADDALAAAHDLLEGFVTLAEALTIDHIRALLHTIVDVLETDLGFTPTFLRDQVWALIDDVVEALEHVAPESDADLRRNRRRLIGAIRGVKRRLASEFEFPQLDVEGLAQTLFALIRRTGLTDGAARAACVGAGAAQIAEAMRDAVHAVPFTGMLTGSVGAGVTVSPPAPHDRYQWYASWLENNHKIGLEFVPFFPSHEIWGTEDELIVKRNPWFSGNGEYIVSAHNWADAEEKILPGSKVPYTFGSTFTAETMETIAWVSSIAASGLEMLLHLTSLEAGDWASNLVNSVGAASYGAWKTWQKKPVPWWYEGLLFRFGLTFVASLQGMHTRANAENWFRMQATLTGPDYAEMLLYKWIADKSRDLLLCIITLRNHKPDASNPHPRNLEEVDAVRHATVALIQSLVLLTFDPKQWGMIAPNPSGPGTTAAPAGNIFGLWTCLGGLGIGAGAGFVGTLFAEAIALDASAEITFTRFLWGIPQAILMTPFWLYVEQEGGTSGGTFTPFQDAAGNPLPAFKGYPKKTTNNVPTPSPYFLPYAPSEGPVYVGQGNQGLFSHNAGNVGQLYSYDFSVDAKTELLAARAGTVVAFSEAIPDNVNGPFGAFNTTLRTAIAAGPGPSTIDVQSTANFLAPGILQIGGTTAFFTSIPDANTFAGVTWTSGTAPNVAAGQGVQQNVFGWNFVAIRHDTLDGTHDLGPGGVAMTTIATYGHGANGGVSAAFARHTPAVATNAILGTVVKQGMPIMDSDSTGISFCNHVHMHVVQFLAATNFLQWGGINNPAFTIPFIFQDVGGDGVCTHFNWYTSGNARVLV